MRKTIGTVFLVLGACSAVIGVTIYGPKEFAQDALSIAKTISEFSA